MKLGYIVKANKKNLVYIDGEDEEEMDSKDEEEERMKKKPNLRSMTPI